MHRAQPDGAALGTNPDSNSDGRISAKEAFDYANSVHHPHDTPNFSQSLSAAGCHLGVAGLQFILPELKVAVDRWWRGPWPEAFNRLESIHKDLARLVELELERREDLQNEIDDRVKTALGVE